MLQNDWLVLTNQIEIFQKNYQSQSWIIWSQFLFKKVFKSQKVAETQTWDTWSGFFSMCFKSAPLCGANINQNEKKNCQE